MMFYVFLFILLLCSIYLGQVVGMMIQCDMSSEFNGLKKYVYMIPFLRIILFYFCVRDSIKEKNPKLFFMYIFCPTKNIMIMSVMVESLPELQKIENRQKIERKMRVSSAQTVKAILFDTQDRLSCRYQFM